jgi:hypothetical protein
MKPLLLILTVISFATPSFAKPRIAAKTPKKTRAVKAATQTPPDLSFIGTVESVPNEPIGTETLLKRATELMSGGE